ncbi:sensor histidine kinase [Clostridium sp.]
MAIKLDNVKIKYKLILLYILGIFVPVIVTNAIFYKSINNNVKQQQVIALDQTVDRINFSFKNAVDNAIGLSNLYDNDDALNSVIEKKFQGNLDYIQTFDSYLKNYKTKYLPVYNQISDITLYVDNPSIINGGGYIYLSNKVKHENWYLDNINSSKQLSLSTYYDTEATNIFTDYNRNISLIKNLNGHFSESNMEKILKINFNYNILNEIIQNEIKEGDIFLVDPNNNIVFSNNPKYTNTTEKFSSFYNYYKPKNYITLSSNMSDTLRNWKIKINVKRADVFSNIKNSKFNMFILVVINLIIPSILIFFIAKSFNKRLSVFSRHIRNMGVQEFKVLDNIGGKDEIGQVIYEFNKRTLKIEELIEDVYKASIKSKNLEIARQQAEMNALQSQINPHFLFNTLETIRMRSLIKKEEETSEIILLLSKMLRRSLTWGDNLVTIKDEVVITEDFLKIQEYRFGEKLKYTISFDEEIENCLIPKLSILTFVENACIHGVENTAEDGLIVIIVKKADKHIHSIIRDNGIGIRKDKLEEILIKLNNQNELTENTYGRGIGIKNVYSRLSILYGENFTFNIYSEENIGTTVEFFIPF